MSAVLRHRYSGALVDVDRLTHVDMATGKAGKSEDMEEVKDVQTSRGDWLFWAVLLTLAGCALVGYFA